MPVEPPDDMRSAETDALGAALALGPATGIVAMWRLLARPDAPRMTNGPT